jgi:hypothetical protein
LQAIAQALFSDGLLRCFLACGKSSFRAGKPDELHLVALAGMLAILLSGKPTFTPASKIESVPMCMQPPVPARGNSLSPHRE